MIEFFGVTWGAPAYIWLLLVVLVMAGLSIYRVQRLRTGVATLAGAWRTLLIHHYSLIQQWLKVLFISAGLFFLVLALMRPQWHKEEQIVAQEGRDVLLALDVSRSMLATDCAPNRLECAKKKIKQLLNALSCERVGLILFSGAAFVQCPLTTDYNAFLMFLDHVDAETISSGTTALDGALERALMTFESIPNRKSKILVIFTDGEDFSSNLKRCKQRVIDQSLHVFTVGVGTSAGAPIPLYDEHGYQVGHQKDTHGKVVISCLHDDILRSLAHDAGGAYYAITSDDSDITSIVSRINRFEREWIEDKRVSQRDEKYHYCLWVSFFCFAIEWIL